MRVGSLFSGVGGFDLGLERAGMELAWHSEIEPHACAVLRERWPDVPNLGDVTKIDGATIPPVDVICGGFPCQDLSVAGKRRGFEGERSVLAFEFLRIVREMREATDGAAPTFLVLENVPGLFTSAGGRDFGALLDALGDLRPMDVAWRVLDSRFFGVAQRRRRVFVVVDFGGERCEEVLALREGLRWNPPSGRAAREDVAGTLGGGSSKRGWSDDLDRSGAFVAGTVSSKWAKGTGGPAGDECYNLVAHSPANRSRCEPGDPAGSLSKEGHAPAVAFYANMGKDARSDGASVEIAGPIAGANGGNKQAVAIQGATGGARGQNGAGIGGDLAFSLDTTGAQGVAIESLTAGRIRLILMAYANATQTDPREVLRVLRKTVDTEEGARRGLGILAPFLTPEVLREDVFLRGSGKAPGDRDGLGDDPPESAEAGSTGAVCEVRREEGSGRTPQGRGSHQQLTGEPGTNLPVVPSQGASENDSMLPLWATAEGARFLREALSAVQEVGRPTDGQREPTSAFSGVRRLTPLETERLQAFPDDWTRYGRKPNGTRYELADGPRYKCMGNAVTVSVAEWIGKRIAVAICGIGGWR